MDCWGPGVIILVVEIEDTILVDYVGMKKTSITLNKKLISLELFLLEVLKSI